MSGKAPVKAGDEQRMQEPHEKGRAYRFGPESCAGSREGTGEALTGGNLGQPLSSEIITLRVPTLS